ncbi:MAG: TMEM165/GDT1 family protein [Bdellovibrionales bacterium]|nr:TMEM165/GDT1 family protein [Bdellovibrionales bacterium]
METLFNSFLLVFAGEMGDKTQLLSLLLVSRYKKPWTILLGVFIATILNHSLASGLGAWVSTLVDPHTLTWILGFTFIGFAFWVLISDKEEELESANPMNVLFTTITAFFLAEMGDKTQLATVALGAQYSSIYLVSIGSTLGMMGSNALAIFLGKKLLQKLDMKWVRRTASLLFLIFGVVILLRQ